MMELTHHQILFCGMAAAFFAAMLFLVASFMLIRVRDMIDNLDSASAIRRAKRATWFAVVALFAVLVKVLFQRHTHPVRLGWHIAPDICLFLVIVFFLYWGIRWLVYLRHADDVLISACWCYRYRTFHDAGDVKAAGEAIDKACDSYPRNAWAWVQRAYYVERFVEKPDLAAEYLLTAEKLLSESRKRDTKDRAMYEWILGHHLRRADSIGEALMHMKRSLELHPDKERARIVKEIEYFHDKEREYD